MNIGTFYQASVYICMCVIAFNLSFAAVTGLGVFGDMESGVHMGDDTTDAFANITNVNATTQSGESYTGMDALWIIVGGSVIGGAAGLFLSWATHTSVFMAIGLFSGIFWSSYLGSLSIINTGGYLVNLMGFVLIGTVLIVFVFAGAVVGMLGGSG